MLVALIACRCSACERLRKLSALLVRKVTGMVMPEFLVSVIELVNSTNVPQQISEVDAKGLFSNGYFLVPFIGVVGYMIYKQALNSLVVMGLGIGLWIFSGSHYMQGAIVDGEIQLEKLLPVLAVWVAAIAVFIYFLFIRSD
ncbi:MAG: hypothetical protein U9N60_04550 [Thermodesulfobacteriota bacterium]|nr:hypothetical protein [Thermodesulfobacteriota bacterium]